MTVVREPPVERPAVTGRAVADALWLGTFASLTGAASPAVRELSSDHLANLVAGLQERGVGRAIPADALRRASGETFAGWNQVLSALRTSVEASPMPEAEWRPVTDVLEDDVLAELLGVSPSSLRRYQTVERPTPHAVAARLHVLALILTDLAGSYNHFGVRRWFERPRPQLANRSPRKVLGRGFDPDGRDATAVRSLSAALAGAGFT